VECECHIERLSTGASWSIVQERSEDFLTLSVSAFSSRESGHITPGKNRRCFYGQHEGLVSTCMQFSFKFIQWQRDVRAKASNRCQSLQWSALINSAVRIVVLAKCVFAVLRNLIPFDDMLNVFE
jgi:hypothetical protein